MTPATGKGQRKKSPKKSPVRDRLHVKSKLTKSVSFMDQILNVDVYQDPYIELNFLDKACSWTLSVLIFQLMTGRLPFGSNMAEYGDNARAANYHFTKQDKEHLSP